MAKTSKTVAVKKTKAPAAANDNPWQSLIQLRRDVDRMFDDLSSRFLGSRFLPKAMDIEPFKWLRDVAGTVSPAVDLVEKDKEFQLTAEVPGMDEKDIEVTVSGGMLTIKGEKRDEKEEKKKDYYLSERHYGAFHRSLRLPESIDSDKIEATFDKGVITMVLPKKSGEVGKKKKIALKAK